MGHRTHIRRAPTLKDLLDQVDAATYLLGLDALWSGHEDGNIYVWCKNRAAGMVIEPKTKYLLKVGKTEVVT